MVNSPFDEGMAHKSVAIVQSSYIPWKGYFELTQSITKGMVEAVAGPLKDLKL